jgi:hypothetical protein
MSQITHPPTQLSAQLRAHRLVALAALLALLAAAAVTLILALPAGDDASTTSVADRTAPAARADGGPEETTVAAEVASRAPAQSPLVSRYDGGPEEGTAALTARSAPAAFAASEITSAARPDESAVAAAIGSTADPAPAPARPDESAVAAAIGSTPPLVRPDESAVAAAIGEPASESPNGPGSRTD